MRKGKLYARRAGALAAAGAIFWLLIVTAGSRTARAAAERLGQALPLPALRWELGDLWVRDSLSPAAVLTLGEAPLLLAARTEVTAAWDAEETAPPPALPTEEEDEEATPIPVEETPLDVENVPDNGVSAKTLVPTDPEGYTVFGRVYISNSTDHELAVPDLQEPFDAVLTGESPQVLILHTHGSEAYTPAEDGGIVWSGDHRTTDSRYNVVRVGDVIADTLGEAGISVFHDRTLYDYPNYSGAYDRSLRAIETYLAQYPSIRFILDVHRDAVEDGAGNQYKVVSSLESGETAAQLTLVVGSDGSGLAHERWMENLRLAAAIQAEALREHPTLMRPVLLRNSRYNQHATTGSLLVEVGAAGNAPEEAHLAGKLFAQSMAEVLQARSK